MKLTTIEAKTLPKAWFLTVVSVGTAVTCLLLAGCGIPISEYETLQEECEALQEENKRLQEESTRLEEKGTRMQEDLVKVQSELTLATRTLSGLGVTVRSNKDMGYRDLELGKPLSDNFSAGNPTWKQLTDFLHRDQTDRHAYTEDIYDCSQYAQDFHDNAERAGIRAAYVILDFGLGYVGHALNAVITTDYGLVYVDCSGLDSIAYVRKNRIYRALEPEEIESRNYNNDSWWQSLEYWEYYHLKKQGIGYPYLTLYCLPSNPVPCFCVTKTITIYW